MRAELRKLHQRRIAQVAIGASALRGQGKGSIRAARDFAQTIELRGFAKASNSRRFIQLLDRETRKLQRRLPNQAWGTARKALNLFLRDVVYSRQLCTSGLKRIEPWLEVPLDRQVAREIWTKNPHLSRWTGVKNLRKRDSIAYQSAAAVMANDEGMLRVELDLKWWRASS